MLRSLLVLIILIIVIVLCGQMLHLPYVASTPWQMISWGGINTFFAVLFYYLSIKKNVFQKRSIYQTVWLIVNAILNAVMVTFFILVAAADATLFFANKPFHEQAILHTMECHVGGLFSVFYDSSTLYFSKNENHFSLVFKKNVCKENDQATLLKNHSVLLYGREWFFGKYYDQIILVNYTSGIAPQDDTR